jgi:HEPN domain-containing protein
VIGMASRENYIRLFLRAAGQRLSTAEFLLRHTGFELDAVYLAGYGVECALKALILRWTPRGGFRAMLEKLTQAGAKGHDFEYLKGLLKGQRRRKNQADAVVLGTSTVHLKVVASWTTELRYRAGTLDPKEARRFFKAALAIRNTCAGG